jgi:3-(3-hydroxy-phenyl)propionate hydroxylase
VPAHDASATAACCSPATPRTRSRRSARAAPTPASRTPTTWLEAGAGAAGQRPEALLDSYDASASSAADENILNSTRSTDFITPKSAISRVFRDAVLARRLVNSGRLSTPTTHRGSPLSTSDRDVFAGAMVPGAPAADAPVRVGGRSGWLLEQLGGHFDLLVFAPVVPALLDSLRDALGGELRLRVVAPREAGDAGDALLIEDVQGLVRQRYDGAPGTAYLLRPDQHVAARWRDVGTAAVREALRRAQGRAG